VGAVRRITRGAVAGAAATAAMSAVMLACQHLGLVRKQPPEQELERRSAKNDPSRDINRPEPE